MISPKIQDDDAARVKVLESYGIIGSGVEEQYEMIARLANHICGTKVSLVSFIDRYKQYFKAYVGTELTGNTRELALCSHAINDPTKTTYVPDTRKDIRFKHNPMVTGSTQVYFYAGVPILSPEGYALGTVCVMDHEPKRLSRRQLEALVVLRDLVSKMLEMRKENLKRVSGAASEAAPK